MQWFRVSVVTPKSQYYLSNPHNNPTRWDFYQSPYTGEKTEATKSLKIKMPTWPKSNTARTRTQVYVPPKPILGLGKLWPSSCFCMTCELRMVFTLFKCSKYKNKKEYVTETLHDAQSLKDLLCGPLQKTFANPCRLIHDVNTSHQKIQNKFYWMYYMFFPKLQIS